MNCFRTAGLCLLLALAASAAEPGAADLYRQARKAEKKGDVVSAYLLYSQAAAKNPNNPDYWLKCQTLRTQASLKAKVMPRLTPGGFADLGPEKPVDPRMSALSEEDLADLKRLKAPPELKAKPGRQSFALRGNGRALFEKVAQAFGLNTVFDSDYQPGPETRFDAADVDFRQALDQLQLMTGSFVVPLSERLFLVVKDTQAKRTDLEPVVAISIPIPAPVEIKEAQELTQGVQQTFELKKCVVDSTRRVVFIRDRVSKVLPAQAVLEQLKYSRAQVAVEVEFMEVDRSTMYSYGLLLPNTFNISWLGGGGNATETLVSLARFLFGHQLMAVGIADATTFATMTKSTATNLLDGEMRSLDGSTATFHVGDKYPIITAGFMGTASGIPPSFTFEDLGLVLKVTPHVHGLDEVSLDLVAEFKLLAGTSVNSVPVVSNRKIESKVRLKTGQWALVSGLMTTSEARAISGIPGLARLPVAGHLFRKDDVTRKSTEVVLVLKPTLLSVPPGEYATGKALSVGPEGRMRIPL